MSAAYTGFGSGPYGSLKYDRSWVTAFVTLGVSASDVYTPRITSNVRVTLGTAVEAIKAADGYFYSSFSLGVGTAIPAVSIGGNYVGEFTLGAAFAEEPQAATEYSSSISFGVSLADVPTAAHLVHDTVTLGTSLSDGPWQADSIINAQLSLGTDFTYQQTAAVTANSTLTFSSGFVAFVSSTGRFIDQWTSVPDSSTEIWTSVSLGFD